MPASSNTPPMSESEARRIRREGSGRNLKLKIDRLESEVLDLKRQLGEAVRVAEVAQGGRDAALNRCSAFERRCDALEKAGAGSLHPMDSRPYTMSLAVFASVIPDLFSTAFGIPAMSVSKGFLEACGPVIAGTYPSLRRSSMRRIIEEDFPNIPTPLAAIGVHCRGRVANVLSLADICETVAYDRAYIRTTLAHGGPEPEPERDSVDTPEPCLL